MDFVIVSDPVSLIVDVVNLVLALVLVALAVRFITTIPGKAMAWTWNWITTAFIFIVLMELSDVLAALGWLDLKGIHNLFELLILASLVMALVMALRTKRELFKNVDLPE